MLKISLIQKTQEFYDFSSSFVENKDCIFVCPNPSIADSVRKRFDSMGKKANSITISKFMKDELNRLIDSDVLANYRGKSELIVILGAIWKKLGKSANFIDFKRAFNLLTEFRSFSTSDHVLETVLENYDEDLSHGVLWLHRFLDQLEIVDEHKSYFLLAEKLREGDLEPGLIFERDIVFYGFDFLTGSQVDLFKAMALRDNILIPFYKNAYQKSIPTDWINWFDQHNLEVFNLSGEDPQEKDSELIRFSKGYLSESLISEDSEFQKVVLATKTLTREDGQEVPFDSLKIKVTIDLFQECFNKLKKNIDEYYDEGIEVDLLKKVIFEAIELAKNEQNYRYIKVCLVFIEKLNEFCDLASGIDYIQKLDFEILFEATELDLPRINYSSISSNFKIDLCSIKDIEDLKNESVAFCMTSNYQGIGASSHNYSESVEKYLASIGPVRRAELEQEVLKSKLLEFTQSNKVKFFIENNLLEHNTNISNLFSSISFLETPSLTFSKKIKNHYDVEIPSYELKTLSASKLQKYYECPRKFALSYINKILPFYQTPGELSVLDLGRIEHLVIETYFKKNTNWDEEKFKKVINDILDLYKTNSDINVKDENLIEIISYTKETIQNLIELKESLGMSFNFELPFELPRDSFTFNGSIDLFAKGVGNQIIVDFKRSNSNFTSYQSLKDFDQVQLWFYLVRLIDLGRIDTNKDLMIGYIDLSNIENSMFLSNSKEFLNEIKGLTKINKIQLIPDFTELIEKYRSFEEDLIERLLLEKSYQPKPQSPRSCTFCSISAICPKEAQASGVINGIS